MSTIRENVNAGIKFFTFLENILPLKLKNSQLTLDEILTPSNVSKEVCFKILNYIEQESLNLEEIFRSFVTDSAYRIPMSAKTLYAQGFDYDVRYDGTISITGNKFNLIVFSTDYTESILSDVKTYTERYQSYWLKLWLKIKSFF